MGEGGKGGGERGKGGGERRGARGRGEGGGEAIRLHSFCFLLLSVSTVLNTVS